MRKAREVFRKFSKAITPEVLELVLEFLNKVVGETVKDKLLRAVLIGALSAVGSYMGEHPMLLEDESHFEIHESAP